MEFIGSSPRMVALKQRIEQVAATEATVLIRGERGVGKELVAAAIHRGSRRRECPFVAINCAALPLDLLASELFGHERGAFTGAVQRSPGLLTAADGGTVFLDEVGDLSLAGQAMLLRFLQEREVRPLGGVASMRVDVRLVAATNVNLDRAVSDGAFRADLHDRLNEITLDVAPLRDRRADIRLLAEHLLGRQARRHGCPVPRLTPDAVDALERYPWPGNVRELEHAMSRAIVFACDGSVHVEDLGLPGVKRSPREISGRQRDIVQLATSRGRIGRGDVMRRYAISGEAARRDLVNLVQLGLLQRTGSRRGSRYAPAVPRSHREDGR